MGDLSPVAYQDKDQWALSPVSRDPMLSRAVQRQDMDTRALLRRMLSLWRSFARTGWTSRHATAHQLLEEQLHKKNEELRVTVGRVGALERAVTVAHDQLALAQTEFEKKLQVIVVERDSAEARCIQLQTAATKPVVITDPALKEQRTALLADQHALAAAREAMECDRSKLRQLHSSVEDVSKTKEQDHLHMSDELERASFEKRLSHRDKLLSSLIIRATSSQHRRLCRRCIAAWCEEIGKARRRRVSGQRVVAWLQVVAKRRSMASWMALVQNSRRVALAHADNELAAALADLTKYNAADSEGEVVILRRQVCQATQEAEAAKHLQATMQRELAACRAQMLAASTQHLAEQHARRHAVAMRATLAVQTRKVRKTFCSWACAAYKMARVRRVVARSHMRTTRAVLARTVEKWVEHCRGPMGPRSSIGQAHDNSDIARIDRAANHAAAETTIGLLEQQLRQNAATAVDRERKTEQAILELETELAATKETVAVGSKCLEQSAQDVLLAKSAFENATERHEEEMKQAHVRMTSVMEQRSAARKKANKLKQEQEGLKLALKLAQTSRIKQKDRNVALLTSHTAARARRRLLRVVLRWWVQECWRAQLARSEQLFSQLTLLAEAQSAAVGLLEDEADSAAAANASAVTAKTNELQVASKALEMQKLAWSLRCVRLRAAAQAALALHCAFGVWKFFLQVQMARRRAKQSWLEHDRASSARIQTLELEVENVRVRMEGLRVLGMDAGELQSDELMELLVEVAEELAAANEAARSEAKRNETLLKQLKTDTDRQLQKLSSPPQSFQLSPQSHLVQAKSRPSYSASDDVDASGASSVAADTSGSSDTALWRFRKPPRGSVTLPSSERSMDDADYRVGMSKHTGLPQQAPISPISPLSPRPLAPASPLHRHEHMGAEPQTRAPKSPAAVQQAEPEQKRHLASFPAEAVPPDHGVATTFI